MLKNKLSVVQSKYLTKKDTRIRIRIWIIKPGSGSWKKPGSTQIRIRHTGTNHPPAIFFSLPNAGGGVALVELLKDFRLLQIFSKLESGGLRNYVEFLCSVHYIFCV